MFAIRLGINVPQITRAEDGAREPKSHIRDQSYGESNAPGRNTRRPFPGRTERKFSTIALEHEAGNGCRTTRFAWTDDYSYAGRDDLHRGQMACHWLPPRGGKTWKSKPRLRTKDYVMIRRLITEARAAAHVDDDARENGRVRLRAAR
jgi:hypothetical protein